MIVIRKRGQSSNKSPNMFIGISSENQLRYHDSILTVYEDIIIDAILL